VSAATSEQTIRVAAIVLAAGAGTRMGGAGKLLAETGGHPMVRHALEAACASRAAGAFVVIGHDAGRVRSALGPDGEQHGVTVVENPAYRRGLAGSLRAGLLALPAGIDGVVVLLGDMPRVQASHVDRLIEAFAASGRQAICVPAHRGRRGNPVLWPAGLIAELAALEGDTGGRALFARHAGAVREIEMPDDAVLFDVDVPADLARADLSVSPEPAQGPPSGRRGQ